MSLLKSFIKIGTYWQMATKNEKNAYRKIAELGCILCSEILGFEGTPSELHHIRRYGTKRATSPVVPLCPEHHRGNTGVHGLGHKGFTNKWGVTEEELLERVNQRLGKVNE